jgi:hypothetical protein
LQLMQLGEIVGEVSCGPKHTCGVIYTIYVSV